MARKQHLYPFWQADKPYLHNSQISDFRFRLLGYVMAFLAGAINAGGFFAVAHYTSHVTGSLSTAADVAYVGDWKMALFSLSYVLAFVLGATHAGWIIMWAKRQRFYSAYGLSMWAEAGYLMLFGLSGWLLPMIKTWSVSWTQTFLLWLLCFIMGMHNTVMTVLSGSVIRSTHMTGTATDLGIELAKILYYRHSNNPRLPDFRVNRPKLKLLLGMFCAFFGGGFIGAWGYHHAHYHFTIPVAVLLWIFGAGSIGYDVKIRLKLWLIKKINAKKRKASKHTS